MLWCFILYNKSFIDQACSVKMAGYWPRSFLDFVSVHKHAKKELGQYPAILTELAWSITHTYIWQKYLKYNYKNNHILTLYISTHHKYRQHVLMGKVLVQEVQVLLLVESIQVSLFLYPHSKTV